MTQSSWHATSLEKLLHTDAALVAILDSIYDGVYIVDCDGKIVFWNRGAEQASGYLRQEVIGQKCCDHILCHIGEDGAPLCHTQKCPLGQVFMGGPGHEAKIYAQHKTRGRFPVLANVNPICDESGHIMGAIQTFRDITHDEEHRILQAKFNDMLKRYVSKGTVSGLLDEARGITSHLSRTMDATVMFADIAGFTSFSEKHTPSQVVDLLNAFFTCAETTITECHGDIDKFIGDAVLAVFVDANDAVAAGRRLLTSTPSLFGRQAVDGEVRLRVGIHSGPAIQGDVGGAGRKDRTIIGDVVNAAHRIQTLCAPDSMLISEATHARLKNSHEFKYDRVALVRGKEQPLSLFVPA